LLDVNYGMTYQDDIYTKVGLQNGGEVLDGYSLSNISARLSTEDWAVMLYVNNLFDEYSATSVRRSADDVNGSSFDGFFDQNRPDLLRNYGKYVQTPFTVGIKFEYSFASL